LASLSLGSIGGNPRVAARHGYFMTLTTDHDLYIARPRRGQERIQSTGYG